MSKTAGGIPLQMRAEDPVTVVIFGASGDLTARKLIPAFFSLFRNRLLPDRFRVLGVARRDWTHETLRERVRTGLTEAGEAVPDAVEAFLARIEYFQGDLADPESYRRLKKTLQENPDLPENLLFYLSIKPDLFVGCVQQLAEAGLIAPPHRTPWSRVVLEKPFGRDVASARALNRALGKVLDESQIFRIDHYLGKETVQNVLSFRFANTVFEPLLNRSYVDHIQVTAAETLGMEGERGGYYDQYGAMRDMVANHLLQIVSLMLMEPPGTLSADSIHNEKVKVLQALRVDWREEWSRAVCRGQYDAGAQNGGTPVPAFREEARVDPQSQTETYCALRLTAENWRWAGVPVFIRTGKRLARKTTEVVVQFKMPPTSLFNAVECKGEVCDLSELNPNRLIFRIQPDEGIFLQMSVKRPAMGFVVESAEMDFSYSGRWAARLPEAYERLLLDALHGNTMLFARSDEVAASWEILQPVMDHEAEIPLSRYVPGSWGPQEADRLFRCSELPEQCFCNGKSRRTGWYNP